MNAQVSFLEGELSLIHIPLDLYSAFLQPILQILLPQAQSLSQPEDAPGAPEGLTAEFTHSFLNLSVTPVECSIVCHTYWATHVFTPALKAAADRLPADALSAVSIAKEAYIALCVMSGGMDAGSRVVDLSSPLALAGIPLFFITTYYSDFILVPSKDRQSVIQALLSRGFEFSELGASFVSPGSLSHPQAHQHHMSSSIASLSSFTQQLDLDPPPTNPAELQDRTFDLLRRRNVVPYIVPGLSLTHCSGAGVIGNGGGGGGGAGGGIGGGNGGKHNGGHGPQRRGTQRRDSWIDTVDARLYACLVAALALPPRFLSVTLAAPDPPSVLLDKTLLPLFGSALVGDVAGDLVPIFLDLVDLPFEATGIVSGVAGKLVAEMQVAELPELSYLSTSKAGAVILSSEHAQNALQILQLPLEGDDT
ncbi:hypothetical protein SCUCBS95973_005053 [Sporothrix curviconia]|uniref:CASTOR ACT domain-containing protein n=1 Tax=Sporothrix curviconia TaxID=1260050 RepID=A0ABP0BVI1_9PEZI